MCDLHVIKKKVEMKCIFKQIRNRTLKVSMWFWSEHPRRRSNGISYKLLNQTDHKSSLFETASHSHLSDVMDLRLNDFDVSTQHLKEEKK